MNQDLMDAYAQADAEWYSSGDADLWDATDADGLDFVVTLGR